MQGFNPGRSKIIAMQGFNPGRSKIIAVQGFNPERSKIIAMQVLTLGDQKSSNHLIKQIIFIKIHFKFLQHFNIFIKKSLFIVMSFLILNIIIYSFDLGMTV